MTQMTSKTKTGDDVLCAHCELPISFPSGQELGLWDTGWFHQNGYASCNGQGFGAEAEPERWP